MLSSAKAAGNKKKTVKNKSSVFMAADVTAPRAAGKDFAINYSELRYDAAMNGNFSHLSPCQMSAHAYI
jgi:hypothetical protein